MASILLTLGFVGIIIAIMTPYVKTGGVVSVVSLISYFYFLSVSNWMPIVLFTFGLLFIVLEIFIPDFGIIGILGAISLVGGLYLTTGDLVTANSDFSLALIITAVLMVVLIRNGYSLRNANKLVLQTNLGHSTADGKGMDEYLKIGMVGRSVTPLRPSGKAVFLKNESPFDVLTSGAHIPNGTEVVIEDIQGSKILVRRHFENYEL